ncbi:MAG: DsbA family protein [Nitriliruptoraceae bacterium]
MPYTFALTFDYLCPFARNANEFVLTALAADAPFDVTFTPFSLSAGHFDGGSETFFAAAANDNASGVLALLAGLSVRDHYPALFPRVHQALFAARHDDGADLKDPAVIAQVLDACEVDTDAVFAHINTGAPKKVLAGEHHVNEHTHQVWGVPTFITDIRAVFVRLMDRPTGDTDAAIERVKLIVELVNNPVALHEFKQVDLPQ